MRRRSLLNDDIVLPPNADALDVVFYNGNELVIRKQENWKDNETPIGIVVVPGHHNRYGDNSCGVMSLVVMDYNRPTSGVNVTGATQSDNKKMYWGYYGANIGNSIFKNAYISIGHIPYQTNSSSTECSIDGTDTVVWPYAGEATNPTSAPNTDYKNEGSYVTATSGWPFADFNGIRNTAAIYVKTRSFNQWTVSTVANASGTTGTPAAACAGRFKTVGTKSFLDMYTGITANDINYGTMESPKDNKGYWYLPAEGELSYLPRYRFEINKTILALNQKYGNVGTQLIDNTYWSSSEYNTVSTWRIVIYLGGISSQGRNIERYTRAFMRL